MDLNWISAGLIFTVALLSEVCDGGPCKKILASGRDGDYTEVNGIWDLQEEQYDDLPLYLNRNQYYYMYVYWTQWEIGFPPGGWSYYNAALQKTSILEADPIDSQKAGSIWQFGPNAYGEVDQEFFVDCEVEDQMFDVMMEGKCSENLIEDLVQEGHVYMEDCLTVCKANPQCVAFSVSYQGCFPHYATCPQFDDDPKGGFYFHRGLLSDALVGKSSYQSSTDPAVDGGPEKAVDGSVDNSMMMSSSCTHTLAESQAWWAVDLQEMLYITQVLIKNRGDCCDTRILGVKVITGIGNLTTVLPDLENKVFKGVECGEVTEVKSRAYVTCAKPALAEYVVVYQSDPSKVQPLTLCEVEVMTEEVGKYLIVRDKLAKEDAEEFCKSAFGGNLTTISDESEAMIVSEFLLEASVSEQLWIGHAKDDNTVYTYQIDDGMDGDLKLLSFAGSSTCSASTDSASCNSARDYNYNSAWKSATGQVGTWYKVTLAVMSEIEVVSLMQRPCACNQFKDITLEFSEGETIAYTLTKLEGVDNLDLDALKWEWIPIPKIKSLDVKISVSSIYTAGTSGFTEVLIYGRYYYGWEIRQGSCNLYYIDDPLINVDPEYCSLECLDNPDCVAFEHKYNELFSATCTLMNGTCTDGEIVDTPMSSVYEKTVLDGVYVGFGECNAFLLSPSTDEGISLADCYDRCNFLESCQAFTYYPEESKCMYSSYGCLSTMSIGSNVEATYYTFPGKRNNNWNDRFVTCENNMDLDSFPKITAPFPVILTGQYCADQCEALHNMTYGVYDSNYDGCYCKNSHSQQGEGPGCNERCLFDLAENCGGGGTGGNAVYKAIPYSEDCVTVSTGLPLVMTKPLLKTKYRECGAALSFICERPYDYCKKFPCTNGGTCHSFENTYNCTCPPIYEGKNCEIDVNECLTGVCQNGATCLNLPGSYKCDCAGGYTGAHCETDIDYCLSDPCQNNGNCTDGILQHTCTCILGYTGSFCETDINDCFSSPCKNGAICLDELGKYQCQCQDGYTGTRCTQEIDECVSDPCSNGATCQDEVARFSCLCKPGYTGTRCETEMEECASLPCQNGATCFDGENKYTCQCVPGFEGVNCEKNTNECFQTVCQNGGYCVDLINAFQCVCVAGFTGDYCEFYIGNPGTYDPWSNWTDCSVTCGSGVRHRSRVCVAQFPELGRGECQGDSTQSAICLMSSCPPVDGSWSDWFPVSECSADKGPGVMLVNRTCTNPPPSNGGYGCNGTSQRYHMCEDELTIQTFSDGDCGEWSDWSVCAGSCNAAQMSRSRQCRSPSDVNNKTSTVLMQYSECDVEGCKTGVETCMVCEGSISHATGAETCNGGASPCSGLCLTSFTPSGGSTLISKQCGSESVCTEAWTSDPNCIRLQALTSSAVGGNLAPEEVVAAVSALNGTCTLCCTTSDCNSNVAPPAAKVYYPPAYFESSAAHNMANMCPSLLGILFIIYNICS